MQPSGAQPKQWAERLCKARRFAQYVSTIDPLTEIPPRKSIPYHKSRKLPHIYTDTEIQKIINAADQLPSRMGLKRKTYVTLFSLLAATGMRVGEAISLASKDVDFQEGVLTIRDTKFGKSRLVPLHISTTKALRNYAFYRDHVYKTSLAPNFFVSDHGKQLTGTSVRWNFAKCSCRVGLRKPAVNNGHGPRIHDLRHSFAVRTLINWYKEGVNVEQRLPTLTTYLGHARINFTYWYLTAVPELLKLAVERLDNPKGVMTL